MVLLLSAEGVEGIIHGFILLFLDLALAINPKLKVEVYEWLFDKLLEYRNDSGDSFKEMTGALYNNCSNKSQFSKLCHYCAL